MTKTTSIEEQWAARFVNLLGGEDRRNRPAYRGSVTLISDQTEVLTPDEMGEADALTIAGGTSGLVLMERAGLAVAEAVRRQVSPGARVAVITGPGNNAGDGYIAARLLAEAGYLVTVGALVPRDSLSGDATFAAASWKGPTKALSPSIADEADIVVDALFGAGLDRPVEGVAAQAIEAVNRAGKRVIAVDLPSGINGLTGEVMGTAIEADELVTFFRLKPGHLLQPGRRYAGRLTVADIGIRHNCLETIRPNTWRNTPALWSLPPLSVDQNKYSRGHAVAVSGPMARTGAARLAARAALRVGAGLVTVASPPDAIAINAAHLTAVMLLPMDGAGGLSTILSDERRNAVVIGPALGLDKGAVDLVGAALGSPAGVVLDADALTAYTGRGDLLFNIIRGRVAPVVLNSRMKGNSGGCSPISVHTPRSFNAPALLRPSQGRSWCLRVRTRWWPRRTGMH